MPVQSVGQSVNLPQVAPTATKTFTPRPGDTLSQATKPESSDGFIMSILKPIGRFFANLYHYIKYACCCCCCTAKTFGDAKLPQLAAEQLEECLGQGFKVEKKSDTLFEVAKTRRSSDGRETMKTEKITFTVEMVPYGESFALKIDGDEALWESAFTYEIFSGSGAVMVKDTQMAADHRYDLVEGGCRVRKGPCANLIAIQKDGDTWELVFVDGSNITRISLNDANSNYIWTVTGLEGHPELIPQVAAWAKSEFDGREMVVVRNAADLAEPLGSAGFYTSDGVDFFLVVQGGDKADDHLFEVELGETKFQLAWATDETFRYIEVEETVEGVWTVTGVEDCPDALEKLTGWARKKLPDEDMLLVDILKKEQLIPLEKAGFRPVWGERAGEVEGTFYNFSCKMPDGRFSDDDSESGSESSSSSGSRSYSGSGPGFYSGVEY